MPPRGALPLLLVLLTAAHATPPGFVREDVLTGHPAMPVSLAWTPDGRLFFTELRTGQVRVIENGSLLSAPFATVPIDPVGEKGLLGLAIDPDYATNRFVYVFHCVASPREDRVVRFRDDANRGVDPTVLLAYDPGPALSHHGGRLRFGPAGMLYVSVGDGVVPDRSQDMTTPQGKVDTRRRKQREDESDRRRRASMGPPVFSKLGRTSIEQWRSPPDQPRRTLTPMSHPYQTWRCA
jgi:glucose/arabinose dehydrogenase